jgi:hypothetical protein
MIAAMIIQAKKASRATKKQIKTNAKSENCNLL